MTNVRIFVVVAILAFNLASPAKAQDKATIDKAVADCLDFVHGFPATPLEMSFFRKFDAFYNPASGLVQNNAVYNGDYAPLFQFNKCMALKGVPLGKK